MCYDPEKTQAPSSVDYRLKQEAAQQSYYGTVVAGGCSPVSAADILAQLFTYHPPTPETLPKFAAINQAAKNFAEVVLQNCPGSADRSAAIRLIRDARMTANASVALNGLSL